MQEKKQLSLQDQVLIAQKEKYLAEAAKAIIERDKIQNELEKERQEDQKPHYRKKKFLLSVRNILLGVTFLSFYIIYVIIPASQYEVMNLKTEIALDRRENLKTADSLDRIAVTLQCRDSLLNAFKDSIIAQNTLLLKYNDSLFQLNEKFSKEYKSMKNANANTVQQLDSMIVKYEKIKLTERFNDAIKMLLDTPKTMSNAAISR